MKFASFDLESAVVLPDAVIYTDEHFKQLGITCAAVALVDTDVVRTWHDTNDVRFWHSLTTDRLTSEDCREIVYDLLSLVEEGYTLVTWNGTGFDFRLLAVSSGMYAECAELAYYHHIDMMLFVVFLKGHYLGLQKALEGIGTVGKLHEVMLKDGSIITNMKGALAPEMWAKGEFNAVLTYLNYDVTEPLAVLQFLYAKKCIQWISGAGNPVSVRITSVYPVNMLYDVMPDHPNWGKFNITRDQFISWMPKNTFV